MVPINKAKMCCERINNMLDHYGNLLTKMEDSLWRAVNKQAEVASVINIKPFTCIARTEVNLCALHASVLRGGE
jgi:hypothetical protein